MIELRIDPERPIEELTGDNRQILRWKLGNMHCMTPFREVLREVRPKNIHRATPALKRGFIKCVAETLNEYRGTYIAVMSGNLSGESK